MNTLLKLQSMYVSLHTGPKQQCFKRKERQSVKSVSSVLKTTQTTGIKCPVKENRLELATLQL